jgi:hypothetical protein
MTGAESQAIGLESQGSGVSSIQPVVVSATVMIVMSHFMSDLRFW